MEYLLCLDVTESDPKDHPDLSSVQYHISYLVPPTITTYSVVLTPIFPVLYPEHQPTARSLCCFSTYPWFARAPIAYNPKENLCCAKIAEIYISDIFSGLEDLLTENEREKEGNHGFGKYQARQIMKQCAEKILQFIFSQQK